MQRSPTGAAFRHLRDVACLLWNAHPWLTLATLAAGIATGFTGVAVIDTVNTAVHEAHLRGGLLGTFVALAAIHVVLQNVSAVVPCHARRRLVTSLRVALSDKILATELQELETRGVAHVLTLLTNDVPAVSRTLLLLPAFLTQAMLFLFALGYIAYHSWSALALTVASIGGGLAAYSFFYLRGVGFMRRVREEFNRLNTHLYGLLLGIKELKLNRQRRRWFRDDAMVPAIRRVADDDFIGDLWFLGGGNIGHLTYLVLIGLLVFSPGASSIVSPVVLSAVVLATIYVIGPVSMMLSSAPQLGEGAVASERLAEFGVHLGRNNWASPPRESRFAEDGHDLRAFRSIELRDLVTTYGGEDSSPAFRLGPISLRLVPGEIVFITGGNGCGKSTLAKVLSGLYAAEQGHVLLDGQPVGPHNLADYRSLFCTVFGDFHLFDSIACPKGVDEGTSRARTQLARLGLADKVEVRDGEFSTTSALSQGLRKRLGLLVACLEDRPIVLLDEWAAEQDPPGKDLFYRTVLQELKDQGKCVLLITHDDRYFGMADRVVHMENGVVVSDTDMRARPDATVAVLRGHERRA